MDNQKLDTGSSAVSEQAIREEIEYYERQAALARQTPGRKWWGLRTSYLDFAARRRMLLAALRDGRPEAWHMPGWSRDKGYSVKLIDEGAIQGERCARIDRAEAPRDGFGNLMQSVDVTRYRVGPSVAAHTGPGTAGGFFWPALDR